MPTLHELLVAVIGTAVAGIAIDLTKFALRSESILVGWVRPVIGALPFQRSLVDTFRTKGTDACARRLVKWLIRDQFMTGSMKGQFGRSQAAGEQARFRGAEAPAGRPRLYQTSWVCFVLTKHGFARRQMTTARKGLEQLLATGSIRAVIRSQRPDHLRIEDSIRHAIRAAHTLQVLATGSSSADRVGKRMLDSGLKWQSASGGWYQLAEKRETPDLWASVYAADYLDALLTARPEWLDFKTARDALSRTVAFLRSEWTHNRWAYSDSLPEENVPQVLACLGPLLQRSTPDLLDEISEWAKTWFTPAGDLSASYGEICPVVPLAATAVRYGHYLLSTQPTKSQWRRLLSQGIEGFEDLNSAADVAMLLDLTMAAAARPAA